MTAVDTGSTLAQGLPTQESRRSPRVAVGRPGRLRLRDAEALFNVDASIIDISVTGCRLLVERDDLPSSSALAVGTQSELTVDLQLTSQFQVDAEVVWAQRYREGMVLVGLRFLSPEPRAFETVDRFVLGRLRAGLVMEQEGPSTKSSARWPRIRPLEQPLDLEAVWHGEEERRYRLQLLALGRFQLVVQPNRKKGEPPPPPPPGAHLDISIYPPAWADIDLRALRFAATVLEATPERMDLEFCSSGHDLSQMIRALIPRKRDALDASQPVNFYYVLFGLAILLVYLILIRGS